MSNKCWICHTKGRLSSGFCACIGSLGSVHQACLQRFVNARDAVACPTCMHPYSFLYLPQRASVQDDQNLNRQQQQLSNRPPIAHAGSILTWFFIFRHFVAPFIFMLFFAAAELCLHWVLSPVLVGAVLLSFRGNAAVYADTAKLSSAWLVGAAMLLMKRRMASGAIEIVAATHPLPGAAVVPTPDATTTAADEPEQNEGTAAAASSSSSQEGPSSALPSAKKDDDDSAAAEDEEGGEEEGEDGDGIEQVEPGQLQDTARTIDVLLWSMLRTVQELVRSPDLDHLDALMNLCLDDLPNLVLHAAVLGASPSAYVSLAAVTLVHNSLSFPARSLESLRDRYDEAGRRLRAESTPEEERNQDRERYIFIFRMDVVCLYFFLPLLIGIVSHEALSSHLVFPSSSSSSSPPEAAVAEHGHDSHYLTRFVAENLRQFVVGNDSVFQRVWRRLSEQVLDQPKAALVFWFFGYIVAGVISSIEQRLISVLFAPGVSLLLFRSFHSQQNEEVHGFSFMLRQLFDLSAVQASKHCLYLFTAFLPTCWSGIALLVNTARFGLACGAALLAGLLAASEEGVGGGGGGGGGEEGSSSDWFELLIGMRDQLLPSLDGVLRPFVQAFGATFRTVYESTLDAHVQDKWSLRFLLPCLCCIVAAGALYLLPHQYLLLRRIAPVARSAARKLGLEDFVFEEEILNRFDEFMELSETLEVGTETVVDLQPPGAPIQQIAVRRERWLEPERVPALLQPKIAALTLTVLFSLLVDWIVEVTLCLPMLAAGAAYTLVSCDGSLRDGTLACGAEKLMSGNGLSVLAFALLVAVRRYGSAILMSLGYCIITPVALVVGILEVFRPVFASSLQDTVDSIFIRANNLRRLVVPCFFSPGPVPRPAPGARAPWSDVGPPIDLQTVD